jgi:hypothetical protein
MMGKWLFHVWLAHRTNVQKPPFDNAVVMVFMEGNGTKRREAGRDYADKAPDALFWAICLCKRRRHYSIGNENEAFICRHSVISRLCPRSLKKIAGHKTCSTSKFLACGRFLCQPSHAPKMATQWL